MVLPPLDSFKDLRMPLNNCICGSDDVAVAESFTLGIQTYAIIKCNKCGREIKRRTYKKAAEIWNKNNPKPIKLYRVIYETDAFQIRHTAIVAGSDEFQAIDNFRKIGVLQKYSDVISIGLYNGEECVDNG